MPHFRNSSGDCCCCWSFYLGSSGWCAAKFDLDGIGSTGDWVNGIYTQGRITKRYYIPRRPSELLSIWCAIDYLNEHVYQIYRPPSMPSTTRQIRRLPKAYSDDPLAVNPVLSPTLIYTVDTSLYNINSAGTPSFQEPLTVDPWHQLIFYGTYNLVSPAGSAPTLGKIWSVGYDGTNNTLLYTGSYVNDPTLFNPSTGTFSGMDLANSLSTIRYCRANNRIYFVEAEQVVVGNTNTKTYVKSMATDGSDVQTLYTTATPLPLSASNRLIRCPRFSVAREKVYWIAIKEGWTTGQPLQYEIWQADLDGTNRSLLYTHPLSIGAPGQTKTIFAHVVSQEKDKLYFISHDTAEAFEKFDEWYELDLDSGVARQIGHRLDWVGGLGTPEGLIGFNQSYSYDSMFELGCHLEPMGPNTKAC